MEDISLHIPSLREAKARAILCVSKNETIQTILENRVPKGNVFEMAKVAGFFAVKNTHQNLPNAHPVPIESAKIEFLIQDLEIHVLVKVKSVCKSDLNMEAMYGASITALTMYDMLKPIDKTIGIREIALLEKPEKPSKPWSSKAFDVAVVVCSNAVAKGIKQDSAGQVILKKLTLQDGNITSYNIIPDNAEQIRALAKRLSTQNQLVIFSGGTGLSATDVTPEVLEPMLDRKIPGIEETMRGYGQNLTPHAMFSRSLAGMIGDCMVLALPGSSRGAQESMDAIFPQILHVFPIMKGSKDSLGNSSHP